ncbi:MAG: helix-turn-helix domain containing protein [Deltaproteobacteria bacterium]|nr:helix-turn-helix domain containing protein [Deltaproteobacteria bacterium]
MELDYLEIVGRMKYSSGLKNDSAVAKTLNITPQALSNYKKKSRIPSHLVIDFAGLYGLSVDWLLTGKGDAYLGGGGGPRSERYIGVAEDKKPYGQRQQELARVIEVSPLAPEELIYVGKLLTILRAQNSTTSTAMKFNIDAFYKSVRPDEKKEPEN